MAKRPSHDAWQSARAKWEADPAESYESVAKVLGVSKQAVGKRAKEEGWEKTATLRSIVERAHFKADQREVDAKVDGEVDPSTTKRLASREAAEDIRADVIERHRADWAEHRALFALGEIKDKFDAGKSAKISAEMLALRQKGERAAYGIEDTPGPANPMESMSVEELEAELARLRGKVLVASS